MTDFLEILYDDTTEVPEGRQLSEPEPEVEFCYQISNFVLGAYLRPDQDIFTKFGGCVDNDSTSYAMFQIRFPRKSNLADVGHVPHIPHTSDHF